MFSFSLDSSGVNLHLQQACITPVANEGNMAVAVFKKFKYFEFEARKGIEMGGSFVCTSLLRYTVTSADGLRPYVGL